MTSPAAPESATPEPVTPEPAATDPAQAVFQQALRFMLWLIGGLVVVGSSVGFFVSGWNGVWSALIGAGLALVFSGTTVLSVLRTAGAAPVRMMTTIMGTWLLKIVVVFLALAVLSRAGFIDRMVLAVVLLLGVIGSAVLDYRAVERGRITYVTENRDEGHMPDVRG